MPHTLGVRKISITSIERAQRKETFRIQNSAKDQETCFAHHHLSEEHAGDWVICWMHKMGLHSSEETFVWYAISPTAVRDSHQLTDLGFRWSGLASGCFQELSEIWGVLAIESRCISQELNIVAASIRTVVAIVLCRQPHSGQG